jgi:diguanylate cyclase (GGDEF)-like protein/PAS domain S-box-containing protein
MFETRVAGTAGQQALWSALDKAMALAEFTPEGRLMRANANYGSILGYPADDARGLLHSDLCTQAQADPAAYEQWRQRWGAGETVSRVGEHRRSDGSTCWLEATYAPVLDARGALSHVLCIATDITARVHADRKRQEHLRRLSLVADATDAAVVIADGSWTISYVNAGFTRMFGWSSEEVVGHAPIALLVPHASPEFTAAYRAELDAGKPVYREEILVGKDGERYWVSAQANPVMDAGGRLQTTVTVITDITEAKMHEVLQRRALEAMARDQPLTEVLDLVCREVERIAPDIAVSVLEVDEHGRLHPLAAPSLPASYSAALDGVPIGPEVGSCGSAAYHNRPVLVRDIDTDPLWADFKQLILPLGYTACWSTPICALQGRVAGTFAFYYRHFDRMGPDPFHQRLVEACTDLCALALEREQARRRIRQLAFYDGLTTLPNRSLLLAQAEQALSAASQEGYELAVIFIDLDRFKQVNDSLGHPAGDRLLCSVAQRIQAELRAGDIAGRLSGDEFVIVLPRCGGTQAAEVIERLQSALGQPCMIDNVALASTASCGIAVFPADGRDMETLLHRADMAMYQAKSGGRGLYSFFSPEMNRLAQERLVLETALRDALRSGGLHLHYQPQVDLKDGRLYGVEAFARWKHAEFGDISPARFIPLAEECGLIGELGTWALREACRQLGEWRSRGLDVPAMSVNLSPTSFHNLDLPRMIADTLDRNALKPQDLTLEITESLLLDTNPGTMRTLQAVHAQGVRLSMDDFDTGYSSLSYLRRLPVSELKLDRSFVADLENDEAAQALSNAILGIGRSLHLTVVAEGVETGAQNTILREQGYPVAQGYLFSRPLPADAFERWMQDGAISPAMPTKSNNK